MGSCPQSGLPTRWDSMSSGAKSPCQACRSRRLAKLAGLAGYRYRADHSPQRTISFTKQYIESFQRHDFELQGHQLHLSRCPSQSCSVAGPGPRLLAVCGPSPCGPYHGQALWEQARWRTGSITMVPLHPLSQRDTVLASGCGPASCIPVRMRARFMRPGPDAGHISMHPGGLWSRSMHGGP